MEIWSREFLLLLTITLSAGILLGSAIHRREPMDEAASVVIIFLCIIMAQ